MFAAGFAAVLGVVAPALAQQQPAPVSTDDEDLVVLTPFDVRASSDVGYVATSSLAGGRTDTALKDTPSAISVITKEFMTDIAATGTRDVAEWTVNATPNHNTSNTVTNQSYELTIRGQAAGFPSRNYFVWYVNSDAFATERLEFARGPNGVLFGDSTAAGLMTTYSKRPILQKRRYVFALRGDSEGGFRSTIDFNEPIGLNGAIRLNLLKEEGADWRDRIKYPREGAQLSFAQKLTEKTIVRAEGEWGNYSRNVAPLSYWDQMSFYTNPNLVYNGIGTPQPATGNATGIARMSANTYVPALPQLGVGNWSLFSRTIGSSMSIFPDAPRTDVPNAPVLPYRNFNLNAPDQLNQYKYSTFTAYVDHRIGDLFLQLAYNYLENESKDFGSRESFYQLFMDINTVLPNGQPNPKFRVPYAEIIPVTNTQGNTVDDLRLMGTYKLSRSWVNQRLSFITGVRSDNYDSENKTIYRVTPITTVTNFNHRDSTNAFRVRLYADEPGRFRLEDIPTFIDGFGELGWRTSGGYREHKRLEYGQLASTTQFFQDRLTLHAGARRDHLVRGNSTIVRYNTVASAGPLGAPVWGASIIPPGGVRPVATDNVEATADIWVTSFNYGAVYFPLPWLGFYANHSETFQPPTSGANFLDGTVPGFSRSEGEDYGLKLVLANGKLSATVNYYDTVETGKMAPARALAEIRRLWINSGRSEFSTLEYRDTQDLRAKGWEFEVVANPTRNLRLTANYARPKTAGINLYPYLRAHYAENLATWEAARQAYITAGNTARVTEMTQDLAGVSSSIDGLAPGVITDHTPKYTGNIYGTYTFYNGLMKNWAFGLGANVRGPTKIGSTIASPYDYYYADEYTLFSGHIAYQRKFGKFNARFQLNVTNILDEDQIVFMSYRDFTAPGQSVVRAPHLFRYLDPRRFIFSTTLSF